jgi:hypothetical protein
MENTDREEFQQDMIVQGKTKFYHYWKQEIEWNRWRILYDLSSKNKDQNTTIMKEVEEELRKSKLIVSKEEDQLRWGQKNGREFNLKEAQHYITDQDQEDPVQQWEKIWNIPQWPKIKKFKWLVLHNRVLTWENLRKRGFIGLS